MCTSISGDIDPILALLPKRIDSTNWRSAEVLNVIQPWISIASNIWKSWATCYRSTRWNSKLLRKKSAGSHLPWFELLVHHTQWLIYEFLSIYDKRICFGKFRDCVGRNWQTFCKYTETLSKIHRTSKNPTENAIALVDTSRLSS